MLKYNKFELDCKLQKFYCLHCVGKCCERNKKLFESERITDGLKMKLTRMPFDNVILAVCYCLSDTDESVLLLGRAFGQNCFRHMPPFYGHYSSQPVLASIHS